MQEWVALESNKAYKGWSSKNRVPVIIIPEFDGSFLAMTWTSQHS